MRNIERATGAGKYRIKKLTYDNGNESYTLEMATSFNRYAMSYEGFIEMYSSDDLNAVRAKRDMLRGMELVSEEVIE